MKSRSDQALGIRSRETRDCGLISSRVVTLRQPGEIHYLITPDCSFDQLDSCDAYRSADRQSRFFPGLRLVNVVESSSGLVFGSEAVADGDMHGSGGVPSRCSPQVSSRCFT